MAILTAAERDRLPDHDFAIPEKRAFPISDETHARNALARVAEYGSPEEKSRVRSAVHHRYPHLAEEAHAYGGMCGDGYAEGGEVESADTGFGDGSEHYDESDRKGYGPLMAAAKRNRMFGRRAS